MSTHLSRLLKKKKRSETGLSKSNSISFHRGKTVPATYETPESEQIDDSSFLDKYHSTTKEESDRDE